MDSLQKRLVAVVAVLTAVVVTIAACMAYSVYIAPNQVRTTTMTLSGEQIPASMDGVSIVYVTDLEFGKMENKDRAEKVFAQIQALNPSILIFGGDLFDANDRVTRKEIKQMESWFNKIKAPLGKFAVLGEMDVKDQTRINQVRQVYNACQVEVLDNSNVRLGNGTSSGINLVGLSTQPDWAQAFSGAGKGQFNLVISHYTDPLLEDVRAFTVSQALCGNSHGTQITWPFFGGYTSWEGSKQLNRAEGLSLDFPYYISSGTGCTRVNARFNAPCEVVYLVLQTG